MRVNSGAQAEVQKKMAEITVLFRAKALHNKRDQPSEVGQPLEEEAESTSELDEDPAEGETTGNEKEPAEEMDPTAVYAKEVIDNGLCGGWATLFVANPDWVEPVYNAVRTWNRPDKMSDLQALADFESHLERVTKFQGAEHVVELLRRAYEAMSRLEPRAGYDHLPKWLDEVKLGQELPVPETAKGTARASETTLRLRGRNAASLVRAKLEELTGADKPGECMAHVESDIHHMAVRVQKSAGKSPKKGTRLMITIVESEKRGIVKVETWDKAEQLLDSWLANDEPDLQTIALRTKTTGF